MVGTEVLGGMVFGAEQRRQPGEAPAVPRSPRVGANRAIRRPSEGDRCDTFGCEGSGSLRAVEAEATAPALEGKPATAAQAAVLTPGRKSTQKKGGKMQQTTADVPKADKLKQDKPKAE